MSTNSFIPPKRLLMGPSDAPPSVLNAMSQPLIGHLDPSFVQMMEEIKDMLRQVFLTENDTTIGCLCDQLVLARGNPLGDFGNASSHSWRNLPILLAGGGYKHGSHVAHDKENNTPFANLFVPLARRMGLELDQFGSSTKSTIRGLES